MTLELTDGRLTISPDDNYGESWGSGAKIAFIEILSAAQVSNP